jgi:chemotaxis protein MotB
MAKFDPMDDDVIGKPGRPGKYRKFPWRLWLWALVMTAGAAAGAYFTWQYRQKAETATDDADTCRKGMGNLSGQAGDNAKKASDCQTALDTSTKKQKEAETQLASLSSNLNASKDELAQLRVQKAEQDKRLVAIQELTKQFAKLVDAGQLKVTARRGQLVLSMPSEVLFPSGVADLSKPGELSVLEVGITLKKFPDRRFLVIGHTDDVPLKNSVFKDNWELSTARALTVVRFLVQAGMKPQNLMAAGAGEHDPVSSDRARNRRIEIALVPAINELPPLPANLTEEGATPKK